jgi:hypothetical protein
LRAHPGGKPRPRYLISKNAFVGKLQEQKETVRAILDTSQRNNKTVGVIDALLWSGDYRRSFSEWAMAMAGTEPILRFDIEGIRASKDATLMQETGRSLVSVLEQLVTQHQSIPKNF